MHKLALTGTNHALEHFALPMAQSFIKFNKDTQHPLTTEDNHELLHLAGFHKIITFYKYFNFEAYLCIV